MKYERKYIKQRENIKITYLVELPVRQSIHIVWNLTYVNKPLLRPPHSPLHQILGFVEVVGVEVVDSAGLVGSHWWLNEAE